MSLLMLAITLILNLSYQVETTVRLLWLSMLKMPPELLRLCVCHLLTWFSIIAEAVFFTDFMGQVIYHGDPTVRTSFYYVQSMLFFKEGEQKFEQ